tara:strand:+ start:2228 stop:2353 length:126 start_codon:yes stop_codon:yes gene_type:complete
MIMMLACGEKDADTSVEDTSEEVAESVDSASEEQEESTGEE